MNNEQETELIECCECCEQVDVDAVTDTVDGNACESCLESSFIQCESCNVYENSDNATHTVDGAMCESCRDDYYYCEGCDEYHHADNIYYSNIQDAAYCDDCKHENLHFCSCCDEEIDEDYSYSNYDGTFCESCYSERYGFCEGCQDDVNRDYLTYCDECGCDYCEDCYNDEHNNCSTGNWSGGERGFLPSKTFLVNTSKRKIGFEIEFFISDGESGNADLVRQYGYIKSDSSLRDGDGVAREFASRPMQGDTALIAIEDVCKEISSAGGNVNRSCGLHVHLDVSNETDAEKQNIYNAWSALEQIFYGIVSDSRQDNTYCQKIAGLDMQAARGTRYRSLNTETGKNTFEVRLHQGTISARKLRAWVLLLTRFFDTFKGIELTESEIDHIQGMKDRDKLLFLLQMVKIPHTLKKYLVERARRFARLQLKKDKAQPTLASVTAAHQVFVPASIRPFAG